MIEKLKNLPISTRFSIDGMADDSGECSLVGVIVDCGEWYAEVKYDSYNYDICNCSILNSDIEVKVIDENSQIR